MTRAAAGFVAFLGVTWTATAFVLPVVASYTLLFFANLSIAAGGVLAAASAWFAQRSNDRHEKAFWALAFLSFLALVAWTLVGHWVKLNGTAQWFLAFITGFSLLFFIVKPDR